MNWSSSGLADLKKLLNLDSSEATTTKPSLNLAAQELTLPPSTESSSGPLPAPIPEPSTWLIFGLILGAAGLRQGLWRRVRQGGCHAANLGHRAG